MCAHVQYVYENTDVCAWIWRSENNVRYQICSVLLASMDMYCLCGCLVPAEGLGSPGTGVKGGCEILCMFSESNQAAREGQSALSTAELFFFFNCLTAVF